MQWLSLALAGLFVAPGLALAGEATPSWVLATNKTSAMPKEMQEAAR